MIGTIAVAAAFWALGVVMTAALWLDERGRLVRKASALAHSSYWRGYAEGLRFVGGCARRATRGAGLSRAQASALRAFGFVVGSYARDAEVEMVARATKEALRDLAALRGADLDAITPKMPTGGSPPET